MCYVSPHIVSRIASLAEKLDHSQSKTLQSVHSTQTCGKWPLSSGQMQVITRLEKATYLHRIAEGAIANRFSLTKYHFSAALNQRKQDWRTNESIWFTWPKDDNTLTTWNISGIFIIWCCKWGLMLCSEWLAPQWNFSYSCHYYFVKLVCYLIIDLIDELLRC